MEQHQMKELKQTIENALDKTLLLKGVEYNDKLIDNETMRFF